MNKPVSKNLSKNMDYIKQELGKDESFDVLTRKLEIGSREAGLIFLDGFIKDELIIPIKELMNTTREDISIDVIKKILLKHLPYYEVSVVDQLDQAIDEILAGPQGLFIDGINKAIIIDGRTWLTRTPDEPELEKATRGPGDGFVETMLFNVNAVRRRIRDRQFRAEALKIGKRSQNDVALLYIKDIINSELVEKIKDKLKNVDIDGLPLADRTVEDIITGGTVNPLPMVRYTERPDNVAAHILEGHLAIIVDNSPTALILPAPFLAQTQTLEVYRKGTIVGSYLSLMRIFAIGISVLLPVIWFLMATNKELLPEYLNFIGVKEESTIGLGVQFILASIGIDLIRMASIQTPGTLATSLSLIGALILGDFAVKVGLFSPEVILYMAVATIGNFAIPGYELAMVMKLIRMIFLLAAIIANIWGFVIAFIFVSLWFIFTKSFGVYYLWPLIPFDYYALKSFIMTQSVLDLSHIRPHALKTKDQDRSVKNEDPEN